MRYCPLENITLDKRLRNIMSGKTLLAISDVNNLTYEQFTTIFGNVVGKCSLCAAAVWQHRPFKDVNHIHKLICDVLDNLPKDAKQGLLRLFPEIAGSVAGLSSELKNEQKSAGIDSLTKDEREKMQERNKNYREKFDFPFVICARKNKKQAILNGLKLRLENNIEEEIALLRLFSIVQH